MIEVHSGGISSLHGDKEQYALDEKRSREMHVVRSLDLGPFPSGSSERSQRRLRLTFTGENSQPFPPQRPHEDSCNPLASGCSPFFCFAHKPAKNAAVKAANGGNCRLPRAVPLTAVVSFLWSASASGWFADAFFVVRRVFHVVRQFFVVS